MSTELTTIERGAAAADAATTMLETGVSSVLVVEAEGTRAGLVTATDFVALVRDNDPHDETPVEAFMTTDVVTVGRDDTGEELADPTVEGHTHLPVTDAEDRPIGIVSTTDLTERLSRA